MHLSATTCTCLKKKGPLTEIIEREKNSITFIFSYLDVIKSDVFIVLNNELC